MPATSAMPRTPALISGPGPTLTEATGATAAGADPARLMREKKVVKITPAFMILPAVSSVSLGRRDDEK
jgi:hypothetical protein